MISELCWVPKGASKFGPASVADEPPLPKEEAKYEDMIIKSMATAETNATGGDETAGDDEEEDAMEVAGAGSCEEETAGKIQQALAADPTGNVEDIEDALRELNMDTYDEEEDDALGIFGPRVGDRYYSSNALDPYLLDKADDSDDDDEEEIQDMTTKPTDALIVCARGEGSDNRLEVAVFEEGDAGGVEPNMYVHHEVPLPAIPLCVSWLDCDPRGGDKGSFVAVGYLANPAIEIWDLNAIEAEPSRALGGTAARKKTSAKRAEYRDGSHRGSVLGLAWNREIRNALASAGADKAVKVWDVVAGRCVLTANHHSGKVRAVAWNPRSPETLLSGASDKSVAVVDPRSGGAARSWPVQGGVECLAWDPRAEHRFVAGLDSGVVQGFDTRAGASTAAAVFTLGAHDGAVCSASYSPSEVNLLATGSDDGTVKLWDLSGDQPCFIASRDLDAGKVFSVSFSSDSPFLLAVGGLSGGLQVWDTMTDARLAGRFGGRMFRAEQPPSGG